MERNCCIVKCKKFSACGGLLMARWPLVLESPGIDFSPEKASWKTDFLEKSLGKVLEKIIC